MSLFGSVLRDDFGGDKEELSELFGRPVEVVTRRGLEASQNHLLREEGLSTAQAIHRDAA